MKEEGGEGRQGGWWKGVHNYCHLYHLNDCGRCHYFPL